MGSTRTALVFPGQGSQRTEMLADVPETDDLVRLLDAAEALSSLPLRELEATGTAAELSDTRVAQPLLYLTGWAWGRALLDSGLVPVAVAGHSLGELTALAIADVYSVEAGLELVVERSKLMAGVAASNPGGMTAVIGLERERIESALSGIEGVWVANDNSASQVVISGRTDALPMAEEAFSEAGARRLVRLNVTGAFHSPLMEPARAAFADLLSGTTFRDASVPVIQNTDPRPELAAEAIRTRLASQITSPVRWTETLAALAADGPCAVVEAGPGSVLTGLAKRVDGISALSVEASGIEAVLTEVS